MLKLIKNNYFIGAILLVSSLLITLLCCLKTYSEWNLLYFIQNGLIIMATISAIVLCNGIFLLSADAIVRRNVKFKERFFSAMKSLWISQFILLPTILILIFINFFISLDISVINKVIIFSASYLNQIILIFSYKLVTKSSWGKTIKIVASQIILMMLLLVLMKFI